MQSMMVSDVNVCPFAGAMKMAQSPLCLFQDGRVKGEFTEGLDGNMMFLEELFPATQLGSAVLKLTLSARQQGTYPNGQSRGDAEH